MKKTGTALTVASVAAAITLIGFAAASCDEKKDVSQKSSEASIVTNDNGSVARTRESAISRRASTVAAKQAACWKANRHSTGNPQREGGG